MRYTLPLSTVLLTAALPFTAFAQIPATPQAQPSRIQQELETRTPARQLNDSKIITIPKSAPVPSASSSKTRFTLKSVTINNNTVISDADLKALYADRIGTTVSLAALQDLANEITNYYRNAGLVLSRAILPPQRIKDGNVTINLIEGFIDQVIFEGSMQPTPLIRAYAEKIRSDKALNTRELERYLLLIQDLPGMQARGILRPSPNVTGASDLVITLSEDHFEGSFSLSNRGTRFVGPVQGGVTLTANNAFGVHDRTQFRALTSSKPEELQYFQISHDEQIGTEGTRLTVGVTRTKTKPGFRLDGFDIEGRDLLLTAAANHPFIRSRQENLFTHAQFDIRHTDSDTQGTPIYEDRLYVARAGASYDRLDAFAAVNRLQAEISKGLGIQDNIGNNTLSRANGRTSFWKATAAASRLQPLSQHFSVFVAAKGQMSSGALLTAEQFGIGGADFGSAYDPSEVTGDSGFAARTELQYASEFNTDYLSAVQFYSFYDVGTAYTRNPAAGLERRESMASAGIGVRFNLFDPISGSIEIAQPLTRRVATALPNHGDDPRVFGALSYRF